MAGSTRSAANLLQQGLKKVPVVRDQFAWLPSDARELKSFVFQRIKLVQNLICVFAAHNFNYRHKNDLEINFESPIVDVP